MNNCIALRLLPKPDVEKPEGAGERARQLGYFPDDAIDRIAEIQRLKREGLSMDQISARLGAAASAKSPPESPPDRAARPAAPSFSAEAPKPTKKAPAPRGDGGVRLTLDALDQPADMVNYNFLVEWCNDTAASALFGLDAELDPEIEARSPFKLMLNAAKSRDVLPILRPRAVSAIRQMACRRGNQVGSAV